MWKALKVVVKWVWVISLSTMYGWAHHGGVGAVMLGFVEFTAGVARAKPALILQILSTL